MVDIPANKEALVLAASVRMYGRRVGGSFHAVELINVII
jgi:hypothetical protein